MTVKMEISDLLLLGLCFSEDLNIIIEKNPRNKLNFFL